VGGSFEKAADFISQAIMEDDKQRQEAAGHRSIAEYALKTGAATPEQFAEYLKAPPAKQNSMLGSWLAIQTDQARKAEALDRDRRTRLEYQRYAHGLAQEEYERNFTPSGGTLDVATGRYTSPFVQAQAAGGTGIPYSPDYSVPETEQYRWIKKSPRGETEIIPPPFKPPTTVAPIRAADTGAILGYPLPTSASAVTYPASEIRPPEGMPEYNPETGELMGIWSYGRFIPTKAPTQAEQLMSLFGQPTAQPVTPGGSPAPQVNVGAGPPTGPPPGVTPSAPPGAAAPRGAGPGTMHVRGPQGQTGYVPPQQLPPGWVQIP
jgi:hypothetical protein